MSKINAQKEEIDYAKVDKLTKEIAKRLNEIRELYLKEYPQGDYLVLAILKNRIGFNNSYWGEDARLPIEYNENFKEKEWEYGKK